MVNKSIINTISNVLPLEASASLPFSVLCSLYDRWQIYLA